MTGGTEFSEDIKQPEIKEEVAQVLKEVNDAALRPAEKIETEMEVKPAEDLQEEFIAVVDSLPEGPSVDAIGPDGEIDQGQLIGLTGDVEVVEGASGADGRPGTENRVDETASPEPQEQLGATPVDAPEDSIPAGEEITAGGVSDLKETLAPLNNNLGQLREMVTESQNALSEGDEDPTKEAGGKSDFGTGTSSASDDYSGVEMTQGEVAQDSDLNTPSPQDEVGERDREQESDQHREDLAALQESMQNLQQVYQTVSNIRKQYEDTDKTIINNIKDGEGTQAEAENILSRAEALEKQIKAWEDQLNSVGDDAELADIDMQGILDKQQETIDMLAAMGEVQQDTADAVIKKTGSGLTSAAGTLEGEESGEEGDNQIVIPAGNGQIDFASAVSRLSTNEFGSEETEERSYSSGIDKLAEIAASKAEAAYSEIEELAANQADRQGEKESVRDLQTFKDELADWPDDSSTREITYNEWEKNEDGSYVKVEKTVTLTKDEAEDLLDQVEEVLEDSEGRRTSETPYQLEEGSLLVGEAVIKNFSTITYSSRKSS